MAEEKNTGTFTEQEGNENEVMFTEKKRLLFFGLPWTFTKYMISPGYLTVRQGFLNTVENDCYMYKIQDVKLTISLMERMFGLSTVTCYTGDVTDAELTMTHIKHGREIKAYLLEASEAARLKRRTLNTLDISAPGADLDHDGIPDILE